MFSISFIIFLSEKKSNIKLIMLEKSFSEGEQLIFSILKKTFPFFFKENDIWISSSKSFLLFCLSFSESSKKIFKKKLIFILFFKISASIFLAELNSVKTKKLSLLSKGLIFILIAFKKFTIFSFPEKSLIFLIKQLIFSVFASDKFLL